MSIGKKKPTSQPASEFFGRFSPTTHTRGDLQETLQETPLRDVISASELFAGILQILCNMSLARESFTESNTRLFARGFYTMALSPSSSPPTQLLALSALGLASLWGGMWFNGTLDGLLRIQQTASFPDGRPMRTRFTGYPLIDSAVMLLVAFFDLISDTKGHAAAPWLLFDLGSLLAAINTWVLIESRRRGVRNLFLRQ